MDCLIVRMASKGLHIALACKASRRESDLGSEGACAMPFSASMPARTRCLRYEIYRPKVRFWRCTQTR